MSVSDILVYADPSPASGERLDFSVRLAHRFGAYLIGIVPEDAAAVGDRFATMLRQEALQGDWQMAVGLAASFVTRRAQAADLVVLGQHLPGQSTGLDAPEDVILACGRPVLVVPYAGHRLERIGENVLVAWNGSREAGRAVQDALPLLAMSGMVTVLLIDPEEEADIEVAEHLVAHVGRHGLHAKMEVIRHELTATFPVSDTLLAQIARLDADLLVMGAYGHSRLREMILGGVTRDILRNMSVPVLMSH
jgi:nucleotide-binding universal stress UspA family protein